MKKLIISALLGVVTMSALSGCYVADPPGTYYARGPRVWVPPHYQWNGYARVWVPGHWRRA